MGAGKPSRHYNAGERQCIKFVSMLDRNYPLGLKPELWQERRSSLKKTIGERKRTSWEIRKSSLKRRFNIAYIPDVQEFTVEMGKWDTDFLEYGLKRRTWRKCSHIPLGNRKLNKYITHMLHCLEKSKLNKNKRVWIIERILRSKVFFIAGLNSRGVEWSDYDKGGLERLFKRYRNISKISENIGRIYDSKRVYILKANGKSRPLGVPKKHERIHWYWIAKCLAIILEEKVEQCQHAVTGRGTATAWKQILSEVIHWDNIYEYDLKGFFDRVNNIFPLLMMSSAWEIDLRKKPATAAVKLREIINSGTALEWYEKYPLPTVWDRVYWKKSDTPNWGGRLYDILKDPLIEYIGRISDQPPLNINNEINVDKALLNPEPEDLIRFKVIKNWVWRDIMWDSLHYPKEDITKKLGNQQIEQISKMAEMMSYMTYCAMVVKRSKSVDTRMLEVANKYSKDRFYPSAFRGYPQGGPHSPFLSMLGFIIKWPKNVVGKIIKYADDFLTNSPIEGCKQSGCLVAPEKSGQVKSKLRWTAYKKTNDLWVGSKAKWNSHLKFLGLVYDGNSDQLRASTRNGSTLELDREIKTLLMKKLKLKTWDWAKVTSSKYWGWIQSRLYNGSWTELPYTENVKEPKYSSIGWKISMLNSNVDRTNMSSYLCRAFLTPSLWKHMGPMSINDKASLLIRTMYFRDSKGRRVPPLIRRGKKVYVTGWADISTEMGTKYITVTSEMIEHAIYKGFTESDSALTRDILEILATNYQLWSNFEIIKNSKVRELYRERSQQVLNALPQLRRMYQQGYRMENRGCPWHSEES